MIRGSTEPPLSPPLAEYTSHDFNLLNRHVDESYERVHRLTLLRGASVFARYAVYVAGVLVAIGVAAVLIAYAYRLAFLPPRPETRIVEIEKPVVVVKEVVVRVPVAAADFPTTLAEAQNLAQENPLDPTGPVPMVIDFTIFRSVEFDVDGIEEVVTGLNYESSNSTVPSFQYCYVTVQVEGLPVNMRIDIGKKSPGTVAELFPISRVMADQVGSTISVLQRAQRLCRFID